MTAAIIRFGAAVVLAVSGRLRFQAIEEDQPRLNFNGPLIADRLYVSQSATYTIAKRPVRGLSFPENETKTESQSYFSHVDVILNGHHTQSLTFGYFPERDQYVGLDFFTPRPTTPNYRQRDFSFSARDHYALGAGLLESVFAFKRFDADVWGQGTADQIVTPTVQQGNYFATFDRRSSRIEFLEIYTAPNVEFLGASHEVKAGFDFNRVSDQLRYGEINSSTRHIYIVNPEVDFHGTSAIVLRSAGYASYRALELTSRLNIKKDDAIYLSYVKSRSRGNLNDFNSYFGDLGWPIIRPNQYSNLAFDLTTVPTLVGLLFVSCWI